jgi:hypothetical protein
MPKRDFCQCELWIKPFFYQCMVLNRGGICVRNVLGDLQCLLPGKAAGHAAKHFHRHSPFPNFYCTHCKYTLYTVYWTSILQYLQDPNASEFDRRSIKKNAAWRFTPSKNWKTAYWWTFCVWALFRVLYVQENFCIMVHLLDIFYYI